MRRNIKDRVFRTLFKDKGNIVLLYIDLNPEDGSIGLEAVTPIPMDPVIRKGVVGDLAFTVGNDTVCLVEAQSCEDPSMAYRLWRYLSACYDIVFTSPDFHMVAEHYTKWKAFVVYPFRGTKGEVVEMWSNMQDFQDWSVFRHIEVPDGGIIH